jgi:hypothetical protein
MTLTLAALIYDPMQIPTDHDYRPKNFILQELVPPEIFKSMGARAWELLDVPATMTLQALRDNLGPIIVNNWHVGGSYKESGLRSANTTTGAKKSQHKLGKAFDCKFKHCSPREARDYVLAHPEKFPHLTTIENPDATPTWFHFDTRSHNRKGVWIVNP